MKFYVTAEPLKKLRDSLTNLNTFCIIDVNYILSHAKCLEPNNPANQFLINTELEGLILSGLKSKRYTGIIYINSGLNCDVIMGLRNSISGLTNSRIGELTLIDDYDIPKMKAYYSLFDEVIFCTTFKKMKIVECKPFGKES